MRHSEMGLIFHRHQFLQYSYNGMLKVPACRMPSSASENRSASIPFYRKTAGLPLPMSRECQTPQTVRAFSVSLRVYSKNRFGIPTKAISRNLPSAVQNPVKL